MQMDAMRARGNAGEPDRERDLIPGGYDLRAPCGLTICERQRRASDPLPGQVRNRAAPGKRQRDRSGDKGDGQAMRHAGNSRTVRE
jgi:hypothetical protein